MTLLFKLMFIVATILTLAGVAMADDSISVTVNGRTYQCSSGQGQPGGAIRYYCDCDLYSSRYYGSYNKMDVATGETTRIKWLDDAGTVSSTKQECLSKLNNYPLCR